jgi:hypothetical protein
MPDLIDVAEARQQLNIEDDRHDTELAYYVSAATGIVEGHVGPVLPRDVTEVQPGGRVLVLHQVPVWSLLSLAPVLTGGTSYAVADLDVDAVTGIVRRLDGGGFTGPLRVTYRAGRDEVPPNVGLAARIIVAHMWETQRGHGGSRPGFGQDEDLIPTPSMGFIIPRRAMELLQPHMLGPLVA